MTDPDAECVQIRPINERDRPAVVTIARQLVEAADTYAFDPAISDDALWRYWTPAAPGQGYVATLGGEVSGIFLIKPNQPGPGAHVANASYAVHQARRGAGIGRQMGEASLKLAAELGFRAMQFNIVIASNRAAVRLWQSLGFEIVGTVPEGFRRPDGAYDDFHVMHRSLPRRR